MAVFQRSVASEAQGWNRHFVFWTSSPLLDVTSWAPIAFIYTEITHFR